jgi:hypothetical protein
MFRRVVALGTFLIAIFPVGCSLLSHEAPTEDIDKAAALFFQRLGAGEFDTIYNDAAKDFRDGQTRSSVADNLKQMADQGKIINFVRVSMSFPGEGKSRIASPVYRTASDHSRAEITLSFKDEGGEWKLFGFAYKTRS